MASEHPEAEWPGWAVLAWIYLVVALCFLPIVVATWVLGRPIAFVSAIAGSSPLVPIVLTAVLFPGAVIAAVEQMRERAARRRGEVESEAGGWWATLSVVVIGLVLVGVLAGVTSFGRAGGTPSVARPGCAYPLWHKGSEYTCVSAAEYRRAGANEQRSGAAIGLFLSAALAATFVGAVRRRRG
jgi:hypothetical protein